MQRIIVFLSLCLAILISPAVTQAQANPDCEGTLPTRITDAYGYVRVLPGRPNNLRNAPSVNAEKVGEMPPYAVGTIMDAPVCADGYLWWYIGYPSTDEPTWTAEASDAEYWLEPYTHPDPVQFTLPEAATDQTEVEFEFAGVSFRIDRDIAAGVQLEYALPNYISDAMVSPPTGRPAPDGLIFTFYNADWEFSGIKLSVYALDDFAKLPDGIPSTLDGLQSILATEGAIEQPENTGFSFLLPGSIVPTLFEGAFNRLNFQNGQGVTYFADYSFSADPISSLTYTFTGLTSDGLYYVTLEQRVTSDLIPVVDTNDFDSDDWEAFYDNFDAYQTQIAEDLRVATPEEFSPSLTPINALLESLTIQAP